MISRISGELVGVGRDRVELQAGSIAYELLVPAADLQRLAGQVGQSVEFHTLQFLESQGQGATFVPRLVGFASPEEREFFELFTTVRGVGTRKALRALELPFHQVAQAIAERDLSLLVSLPEIGRRTAETIVASLRGKIDRFVEVKPAAVAEAGRAIPSGRGMLMRDAAAVLVQLGEPPLHARQLVDRALSEDPSLETAEDLVAAAFRLKEPV